MSVMLRVTVELSPMEGMLKGLSTGDYNIMVPDHKIDVVIAIQGGPRQESVVMSLTADAPQLIADDYTDAFVTVTQLRSRMR